MKMKQQTDDLKHDLQLENDTNDVVQISRLAFLLLNQSNPESKTHKFSSSKTVRTTFSVINLILLITY